MTEILRSASTLGLFVTHQRCDRVDRHLERLQAETEGLVRWELVFNPDDARALVASSGRVHLERTQSPAHS